MKEELQDTFTLLGKQNTKVEKVDLSTPFIKINENISSSVEPDSKLNSLRNSKKFVKNIHIL